MTETPRARLARVLYDACYPNAALRTDWWATSQELRSTFLAMADAVLAAGVGADHSMAQCGQPEHGNDCLLPSREPCAAPVNHIRQILRSLAGHSTLANAAMKLHAAEADLAQLAQRDAEGQRLAGALAAAEGRAEALRAFLRENGRHAMDCQAWGWDPCSCGLAALLAAAPGAGT